VPSALINPPIQGLDKTWGINELEVQFMINSTPDLLVGLYTKPLERSNVRYEIVVDVEFRAWRGRQATKASVEVDWRSAELMANRYSPPPPGLKVNVRVRKTSSDLLSRRFQLSD
jgi:hypothetical protein